MHEVTFTASRGVILQGSNGEKCERVREEQKRVCYGKKK